MPIVKIDSWPLKPDMKPVLIKKITDAFVAVGIPAMAVTIIINESAKENWGTDGNNIL